MPTLVELATQIVAAQTSSAAMSTEDILSSLTRIHSTLGQLENGVTPGIGKETTDPSLTLKQAFKKNEVVCMICGKGFKTLGHHLTSTHGINPRDYRKQFGIPKNQTLAAKVFSDTLKKMAVENGVANFLTKAREARADKAIIIKKSVAAEKTQPTAPEKAAKAAKAPKAVKAPTAVKAPKAAVEAAAKTPAKYPAEPATKAPKATALKPPRKNAAKVPRAVASKTAK